MNDGEALVPAHGKLTSRLGNSLAAVPRDAAERDGDIRRDEQFAVALLHVAIGIEAFRVLTHHDKIERAEPVAQSRIGSRRPHIRKQIEIFPEVFRRVDFSALLVLEIKGGGGTEDQAVGGAHGLQQSGPNGGAELPQAFMPDRALLDLHVQLETLGRGPQHGRRRGCDLRPDAVARQNNHAHHELLAPGLRSTTR
ncbi:hypothetical protein GALL_486220 [mine drainage metagenome]|uniref:Uncharacterized protein n=1 Tax=mine drainage metagenome TaxID=410659 RepID=A0A1J5Q1M8_9ZZZZ